MKYNYEEMIEDLIQDSLDSMSMNDLISYFINDQENYLTTLSKEELIRYFNSYSLKELEDYEIKKEVK